MNTAEMNINSTANNIKMKKAQGLSMNMLAIAALVLIVILVVVFVFYGIINDTVPFFKERTDCLKQPGVVTPGCFAADLCNKADRDANEVYGLGCKDLKPYCCIKNT